MLDERFVPVRTYNLLRRLGSVLYPTDDELRTLAVHSRDVRAIAIVLRRLRELMSQQHLERWNLLWRMLTVPDEFDAVPNESLVRSKLPLLHADKLVGDGILHRVSAAELRARPTKACGRFFFVKELKDESFRLRPIYHPLQLNDALDKHYKAEMDLRHVGTYLDMTNREAAVVGDLAISFFQIVLPESARAWFRLCDVDGNIYEMTRMPMGHIVSAELMQLAMEVICGCTRAIDTAHSTKFANPRLRVDVWVDNVRAAGTRADCEQTRARIVRCAEYVGAVFKEGPDVLTRYTFIGVSFNHDAKTVRVAKKTLDKIGTTAPATAPRSTYVKLVARLIFASGALRIPLGRHYLLIKMANRFAHALNSGGDDEVKAFPPGLLPALQEWVRAAHGETRILPVPDGKPDIVYTDASLSGWGAYIFFANGETAILGGAWPRGTERSSGNMAQLEAQAVANTWAQVRHRLIARRNFELKIDNSSVSSQIRRGIARSAPLNDRLTDTIADFAANSCRYTITLIKSADNLADAPSRGLPTSAVANPDSSRGVAGRDSAVV